MSINAWALRFMEFLGIAAKVDRLLQITPPSRQSDADQKKETRSMRRHLMLSGWVTFALAAITSSTVVSVPMDPYGAPSPIAAGPTATFEQVHAPAQAKHAATPVAGIGLVPTTIGIPAFGDAGIPARLDVAGATAEKVEAREMANGTERPRHRAPFVLFAIVVDTAGRRGVPIHILAGLAEDESSWRADAVSEDGETLGVLQLKEGTAAWCGPKVDRLDAAQNIDCGARYLYAQYELFGSWELALAAYKAGPSRIPEDIPAQAWVYVQRTLARAEAYR